jgi:hypothetical protein
MEGEIKMTEKKPLNKTCSIGFWFGIASIFLYFIGIIPLVGIIISIVGLIQYKKETQRGRWQGITGLILNCLYFLMSIHLYGHI